MREIVIKAESVRDGRAGWGFTGMQRGKGRGAHTVARGIVAAQRDPEAIVMMVDDLTTPTELVTIALARVKKDCPGIRVGHAKDGRAFVTTGSIPDGAIEWFHPTVREGAP